MECICLKNRSGLLIDLIAASAFRELREEQLTLNHHTYSVESKRNTRKTSMLKFVQQKILGFES